jgi:hypothetical protein
VYTSGRPKWQGWSGSHPRLRSRSVDRPKPLCFESEIVYLELFLVYCSLRILRAKNHVFSTEIRCFGLEIRCAPDRPFRLISVGRRSRSPLSLRVAPRSDALSLRCMELSVSSEHLGPSLTAARRQARHLYPLKRPNPCTELSVSLGLLLEVPQTIARSMVPSEFLVFS